MPDGEAQVPAECCPRGLNDRVQRPAVGTLEVPILHQSDARIPGPDHVVALGHRRGEDAHAYARCSGTPVSTSIWSIARTDEVLSSRNRARVAPGPTFTLTASGGSETKRSSSVRSSPTARMVVRAS